MLSKLVAVAGNLIEDGLGINPESAFEMENAVDVILHSAGNTTFDERYESFPFTILTKGNEIKLRIRPQIGWAWAGIGSEFDPS